MKTTTSDPGAAPTLEEDLQLAIAVSRGETQAVNRLIKRLVNRVRATVNFLASGHADADDWAQLALIEVLRSVGTFRGECPLENWSERIVIRTAMRHIKTTRWRGQIVTLDPNPIQGVNNETEQSLERRQVLARVSAVIGKLSPKYREVITLRLLLGHTTSEIAETIGMSFDTAKYRLKMARKKLRDLLEEDPMFEDFFNVEEI